MLRTQKISIVKLQGFFKAISEQKKIHLAAGILIIAATSALWGSGAVSESSVAALRNLMKSSVSGESIDYYLRKLNLFLYTAMFCGFFITVWSFTSLYLPALYDRIVQWFEAEGFSRKSGIFLLFSFAAGIFFRFESYLASNLWNDTFSLTRAVSSTPWSALLTRTLPEMQSAPPGVLVLIKSLGECFGYDKYVTTFPMFIIGSFSLFVFYKLLKKLFSPQVTAVIFFLFAFNASAIFYSGELKQYIFDLFFAAVLLYHTVVMLKEDSENIHLSAIIAGVTAVLFSHASFLFLTSFGALLFFKSLSQNRTARHRVIVLNLFWASAAAGALALSLVTMPQGMYDYHSPFFAPWPFSASGAEWYWTLFGNVFAFPNGVALNSRLTGAAAAVIFTAGAAFLLRRDSKLFICGAAPVILMFAVSFCKKYPIDSANNAVSARLLLFTIPFVYLFMGEALEYLLRRTPILFKAASCWFGAMAVLLLLFSFPIHWNVFPLCSKFFSERNKNEAVFVNNSARLVFDVYLKGRNVENCLIFPEDGSDTCDWERTAQVLPKDRNSWIFLCHIHYADQLESKLENFYRCTKYDRAGGVLFHLVPKK